jgi:hypothetical protein
MLGTVFETGDGIIESPLVIDIPPPGRLANVLFLAIPI